MMKRWLRAKLRRLGLAWLCIAIGLAWLPVPAEASGVTLLGMALPSGTTLTSSGSAGGTSPSYANDGNTATYWEAHLTNPWFRFTLPSSTYITGFQIVSSAAAAGTFSTDVKHDITTDWVQLGSGSFAVDTEPTARYYPVTPGFYQKLGLFTSGYARVNEIRYFNTNAPTGLTAVPASGAVQLTWNADSSPEHAHYRVYMDGNPLDTTTSTAYLFNGLTPNESHAFYVTSVNGSGGESNASITVNAAAAKQVTGIVLTAAKTEAEHGESVTLTANVTPAIDWLGDTVDFYDNGILLGTVEVVEGSAEINAVMLDTGSHTLTAAYSGTDEYEPSNSQPVTMNVAPVQTTVTLDAIAEPIRYGMPILLSGVVESGTGVLPSGSIDFYAGEALLGSGVADGTGSTAFTFEGPSWLAAGTHDIHASFAGNANFASAVSAVQAIEIVPANSATALTIAPANPSYGDTVTLTAEVTPEGNGMPTGTVTFTNGADVNETVELSNGTAAWISNDLPSGTDEWVASYSGDGNFSASSSAGTEVTIGKLATSIDLASSHATVSYGESVTLTANVTPAIDWLGDTVDFYDNGILLGTVEVVEGSAEISAVMLDTGSHTLTAAYSGTDEYEPSNSQPVTMNVAPVQTTVTLDAIAEPIRYGLPITLSATVESQYGAVPIGPVGFHADGALLGAAHVDGSGVASLTLEGPTWLDIGTHQIHAAYAGDTDFLSASSAVQAIEIQPANSATALTITPANPSYGDTVTLTAAVTPEGGGSPTGSVTFTNGVDVSEPVELGNGTAVWTIAELLPGTQVWTASYGGDESFSASNSAGSAVTVGKGITITALASSQETATYGESVTFTSTVSYWGEAIPTGSVTFSNGAGVSETVQLDGSGAATFTANELNAGYHTITVVYEGDARYLSSSRELGITIAQGEPVIELQASSSSITYGDTVTVEAALAFDGTALPGETVVFKSDGIVMGTDTTDADGIARYETYALAAGSHALTAEFAGSLNYLAAESSAINVTVAQAVPALSLSASASHITYGDTVSLTASLTVDGEALEGAAIIFNDGDIILGMGVTDADGIVVIETDGLSASVSVHVVTASYVGDENHSAVVSSAVNIAVTAAETVKHATELSISFSDTTPVHGQSLTVTAALTSEGEPVASGVILLAINGQAPIAMELSDGTASYTIDHVEAGELKLTASFAGTVYHDASAVDVSLLVLPGMLAVDANADGIVTLEEIVKLIAGDSPWKDINGDGNYDAADARLALQAIGSNDIPLV